MKMYFGYYSDLTDNLRESKTECIIWHGVGCCTTGAEYNEGPAS